MKPIPNKELKVIDLFCGAGGFSHGLTQAGFSIIAGIDNDQDAIDTFCHNHEGSIALCDNIEHINPKDFFEQIGIAKGAVDCIVGGPPCQGFSKNRAYRFQEGKFVDDPRNHLFWHFFDFIEYIQPKIVILENVPEILTRADGYFKEAIYARFHELGYAVDAQVINAAHYGVPQHRKRAIFLAYDKSIKLSFPAYTTQLGPRPGNRTPNSTKKQLVMSQEFETTALPVGPSTWDAIGDLYGVYAKELDSYTNYASSAITMYQEARRNGDDRVRNHFPWKLSQKQLERIQLLKEGQGQEHLPKHLQTKSGYGSAYRRLHSKAQALTLTTWLFHPGSGMFTHPFEHRVITIREAARLQSFQDHFEFLGTYHSKCRQIGNSVAPLVAYEIGKHIKYCL